MVILRDFICVHKTSYDKSSGWFRDFINSPKMAFKVSEIEIPSRDSFDCPHTVL